MSVSEVKRFKKLLADWNPEGYSARNDRAREKLLKFLDLHRAPIISGLELVAR